MCMEEGYDLGATVSGETITSSTDLSLPTLSTVHHPSDDNIITERQDNSRGSTDSNTLSITSIAVVLITDKNSLSML